MQALTTDVAPLIDSPEQRALSECGRLHPCLRGADRTQARECGHLVRIARRLPVALAARQEADHSFRGHQFEMLDLQPDQFIAAESSPKPQQHQRLVAHGTQGIGMVGAFLGSQLGLVQPPGHLGQLGKLQRRGLLFDPGV